MSRSSLVGSVGALFLAAAQVGCTADPAGPAPDGVLLITIDTLRADHLGCYGDAGGLTPNIDALASQGVRFTDASTPVPITLPAHTSLFTGVSPPLHGVRDNGTFRLGPTRPTLAEMLGRAGWEGGAFVGAVVLDAAFGLDRGFSHYDDDIRVPAQDAADSAYAERHADSVVEAALAWLADRPAGSRFFLWVHLFDPHAPYDPPPEYAAGHGATYRGEVAYTDHQVGRLLDGLAELGLDRRTLTVLTSDHGEGLGEHGETTHGFFLYQSTVHVPLIMRFPARFPAGLEVEEPVDLLDVLPTVLDAAALEHPPELEGISLLAAASGHGPPAARSHYLETYLPYFQMRWSGSRGLRDGAWKYIEAPVPELYELDADPSEQDDRSQDEPKTGARLLARLEARARWMEALWQPQADAPRIEDLAKSQIRSLGYLAGAADPTRDVSARSLQRPDTKLRIHLVDDIQEVVPAALDRGERRAIERLRQLVAEDHDNPRLLTLLGSALERQGDRRGALVHLRRATELEPDDPRAHANVALLLMKLGWIAEANASLDRALALPGGNPHRRRFLATLLVDMGRAEEADAAFRLLLQENPDDLGALYGLGRSLAAQARRAEALSVLERSLALEPDQPEVREFLETLRR